MNIAQHMDKADEYADKAEGKHPESSEMYEDLFLDALLALHHDLQALIQAVNNVSESPYMNLDR